MTTPTDPLNLFRDVVTQWEKLANDYGAQFLGRPEAASAMHKATAAGLQVQNAVSDAMAKVLTAANMPSKAEVEALGERMSRIEASLARIEGSLATASVTPAVTRPSRGRKPPVSV